MTLDCSDCRDFRLVRPWSDRALNEADWRIILHQMKSNQKLYKFDLYISWIYYIIDSMYLLHEPLVLGFLIVISIIKVSHGFCKILLKGATHVMTYTSHKMKLRITRLFLQKVIGSWRRWITMTYTGRGWFLPLSPLPHIFLVVFTLFSLPSYITNLNKYWEIQYKI